MFQRNGLNSNVYPFNLPFLSGLDKLKIHPQVTFFVGENGMGKSTLIEAIAIASGFNAEGGSKNFNFSSKSSHSDLHLHVQTTRGTRHHSDGFFLRSESFYNVATQVDELDMLKSYGNKSLHEQSHGESFWALFMNRFRENGFYVLDEPEAALSSTRQMAMLYRLHELLKSGSQFIIATHSPILIAYPNSTIYEFGKAGLFVQKSYKETELFESYAHFIKNSDTILHKLLLDNNS